MVDSIKKNKYKLFEMDKNYDWVIQPNKQRINLLHTIDLILDFNKKINYKNKNENEDNENKEEEKLRKEYENKKKKNEIIKKNDDLDKIIDKSIPFEDQIKSLKKVENLDDCYYDNDYDNNELKLKIFKLKLARFSNIINKKLFDQITLLIYMTLLILF